MLNPKKLLLLLATLFISGCASVHVSSSQIDAATITVQNPRKIAEERHRPFVAIRVNGKRVERTEEDFAKDPESSYVEAKINPGKVELKVEVTAYKLGRAKYNALNVNLDLSPNGIYHLITIVPEVVGKTINSDSWADVRIVDIESGKEILNKRLILEDNWMRSIPEDQSITVPIIL